MNNIKLSKADNPPMKKSLNLRCVRLIGAGDMWARRLLQKSKSDRLFTRALGRPEIINL
jgi:hypothetical protein